jgi:hypothetical protein
MLNTIGHHGKHVGDDVKSKANKFEGSKCRRFGT